MVNRNLSTEELVSIWEDRREIKNLMGRYANWILLNRQHEIFGLYWSTRDDVCLGLNSGFYSGAEAVSNYYCAIYEGNVLKARVLQDNFPEQLGGKSADEIYGIGPMKAAPGGSSLIEVAGDRLTAKGLWHIQGTYADVGEKGPVSHALWGYYAADYIMEEGQWKLWHLQEIYDIDFPSGQSWGKPAVEYPDMPSFAELKSFSLPAPNVPMTLREEYSPLRPYTPPPRLPEPYGTFSETFSYGL